MGEYSLQGRRETQLSNLMKNGGEERWLPEKDGSDSLTEKQNPTASLLLLGYGSAALALAAVYMELPVSCHVTFHSLLHCVIALMERTGNSENFLCCYLIYHYSPLIILAK